MTLAFSVTGQTLRPAGIQPRVVSDSVDFVALVFKFDVSWGNLTKVAQFTQNSTTYNMLLADDGSCVLPSEIVSDKVDISVFGQAADSTVRATTQAYSLTVDISGFVGDSDTPIPPTADLYSQLLAQIEAGGDATGVVYGDGLKLESGVLSVDTTDTAEQDNTKPITSAGVYTEIGNINAILATI